MKNKLNTMLFPLTGFAEVVWDIGTKVAAACTMVQMLAFAPFEQTLQ